MYFVPAQPWDNAEASVSSLSLSDEFEHELRRRQETQKRPQDYRQHENRQQEQSLSRRMSVDGTRSLSRRGSIVGSAGNGDEWYNNNTSAYHRTNSMSSSQHSDSAVSRSSSLSRRPSSAQGGHYRDSGGRSVYTTNQQRAYAQQQLHQQQMLRHRQSYDGHFYNMNQRYQNGPYPATSRDYYDPWLQQVYAGPYQPPYVPRSGSHYRNRSMGSSYYGWPGGGRQVPYRVLHSYNSPAYRNVPIWG